MKEKKLLKIQPLPKVLRVQAIRSKQLRKIYKCYIRAYKYACTHAYKHVYIQGIHKTSTQRFFLIGGCDGHSYTHAYINAYKHACTHAYKHAYIQGIHKTSTQRFFLIGGCDDTCIHKRIQTCMHTCTQACIHTGHT
jgi:hypothetical protein